MTVQRTSLVRHCWSLVHTFSAVVAWSQLTRGQFLCGGHWNWRTSLALSDNHVLLEAVFDVNRQLHTHNIVKVYSRFPDGYFPGWFFSRKDDSRMVTFPERCFPGGHFPGWDNFLWLIYRRTPNMNNTVYKFIPRRKARAFNPTGLRQMPNSLPPQF